MPAPTASEPLRHLLVPDAAPLPGVSADLPPLPNLAALLARLRVEHTLAPDADSPASPHELAAARANGLHGEPGRIPWAAFESGTVGTPCAWLRPVHLQLGMDAIQLLPPEALQLEEAASEALLAACAPLLAEDGVAARHAAPGLWLAQGEPLRGVVTLSPEHAAGRRLSRAELVQADDPARQRLLARLQSELEMLLAAHPVNQAREAARQLPVNAVWISGAGELEAALPPRRDVLVAPQLTRLLQGESAADPAAHAAAWQAIDAELAAPLLAALRAGEPVRLTLSGPLRAVTLASGNGGLWQRISSLFGRQALNDVRSQL